MFGGGSDVKLVARAEGAVSSCGGGWDTSMLRLFFPMPLFPLGCKKCLRPHTNTHTDEGVVGVLVGRYYPRKALLTRVF